MTQAAKALSRRRFLLAAGGGTAAAAAALLARTAPESERRTDKAGSRGYRVSEHINNYYRTTEI